ncbi:MAG TPA: 4-hydroxy-3-methylbut-2-enyl diphosphate reductase [Actinomycetota bacterium]|nr:4-hydroxy-3-methylbut-2-enyl diphosphate reductase [Actinomycetota bacterium]
MNPSGNADVTDGQPTAGKRVVLAAPRGYCAGVERAVEAVERALAKHGAPVYVRKQIVHNLHVVRDLEAKGAIFVGEVDEVPEGAVTVLSAHGSPPTVFDEAGRRRLQLIDATCPLVTKVHVEARRFAAEDRTIVLIGHAGHEEVEGTSGQAPSRTVLVQDLEDARSVELPPGRLAYLTQTTLSVDETGEIVEVLRARYPHLEGPPREDICYATQNRQDAVKELAPLADVVLVIGSKNSSNSNRLAEVAVERGTPAYLVDDESEVDPAWLDGAATVGLTSGASAPDHLVSAMLERLASLGFDRVEQIQVAEEGVRFSLPAGVRGSSGAVSSTS